MMLSASDLFARIECVKCLYFTGNFKACKEFYFIDNEDRQHSFLPWVKQASAVVSWIHLNF